MYCLQGFPCSFIIGHISNNKPFKAMIQVISEIMCWFWMMRLISMFTPMYYYVTLRSVLSENKQEIKPFLTTSCTG